MVFDKDDNVEEKLDEIRNKVDKNAEELKNFGNERMKIQNFVGAVNIYKLALTKTSDPTLTTKLKMVLHGNIS